MSRPNLFPFLLTALFLAVAPLRAAEELPPTIIECAGALETISTDTETIATFTDQVVITGNNLKLYCNFLKVVAINKGDSTTALGEYSFFKSLVATGNVRIVQGDREATCGRAEVFPNEDRILLSEDPVVRSIDGQYVVTGPEILLYRGQRRAVVRGTAKENSRIILPAMKNLGFEEEEPTETNTP